MRGIADPIASAYPQATLIGGLWPAPPLVPPSPAAATLSGGGHEGGLFDRRRRIAKLRAGQSAERGPRRPGVGDRSRWARLAPLHPHPGRFYEAARPPDPDLRLSRQARS